MRHLSSLLTGHIFDLIHKGGGHYGVVGGVDENHGNVDVVPIIAATPVPVHIFNRRISVKFPAENKMHRRK